ncbi:MAG TPA: acyl-CoA dehydrogenase [Thermoanaerobaculia bacterium]|jgi:alkylation response protein AidB-like acyl-CoA dehydrogenase|nr:acyl-CoA dehydrogenase [Thermoanaerobaculia bacterium]
MDFDLSKPQKLLKQSARELLARECPPSRVRRALEASDEALWQTIVEQGWTDLLSIGVVELAVVMEEAGRVCMPGPFLPTMFAAAVLSRIGASEELGERKATVAMANQGTAHFVMEAHVADLIVMVQGGQATLIESGAEIRRTPSMDETRKLSTVTFHGEGKTYQADIGEAIDLATVALCAEMVGGMQWVLDTTVDYAKTRQQFGKPIGSFQAIQHLCADMLLLTESARSATYYAAYDMSPAAVSMAKAYCSDAYREVCNKGIQVHGGIGFTWEHDLQLYYKRAKASETLFGDATFHRERIARLVVDPTRVTSAELAEVAS